LEFSGSKRSLFFDVLIHYMTASGTVNMKPIRMILPNHSIHSIHTLTALTKNHPTTTIPPKIDDLTILGSKYRGPSTVAHTQTRTKLFNSTIQIITAQFFNTIAKFP
jgi:hypothetical protein